MKLLTKSYALANKQFVIDEMKAGKIFIYPTDTSYSLGCDATNQDSVNKIRQIKKKETNPFLIISPSLDWIYDNCKTTDRAKYWLKKLPGPLTLILPIKEEVKFSKTETIGESQSLGVKIPASWFHEIIKSFGKPFIKTHANNPDQMNMTNFYDLEDSIKNKVDYIIYEGSLKNKPSTIVDLTKDPEEVTEQRA
jgi:tRNA threonylcarbamoyl adenosine modification protein (Sua5/YciO/YrdC/YwlC family)